MKMLEIKTIQTILNNYYVFNMDIIQDEVVPCVFFEGQPFQYNLVVMSKTLSNSGDSVKTQDQAKEQSILQLISDEFKVERELYSTMDTKAILVQHREKQQFLVAKVTNIPEVNTSATIHLVYQTQFFHKLCSTNVSYLTLMKNMSKNSNHSIRLIEFACRGDILSFITNNLYSSIQEKLERLKTVKNILWQVIYGLEEIHNMGYAYRDLKPDNIVINHEGHILLTDFGLVAPLGVIDQSICGTPEYMAPQRISKARRTLPISTAQDFWSLGILAFQLLMGYTPYFYQEGDIDNLLEKMYGGYVSFDEELPSYCKKFVFCLLQNNPTRRMSLKKIKQHQFFKDFIQQPLISLKCNCKLKPKF